MCQCEAEYILFEPDRGEQCGKSATAACFDCGIEVCRDHSSTCDICGRTFCEFCVCAHAEPGEVLAA